MKTMICLILDRSGSMGGRESDVINGVNSFLDEQKKLPDPASVAFVRFDSEAIERFRSMENLAEVKSLSKDEYQPRGGTPLLDAIGKTIVDLDEDWKREQPDKAIMVIVTDGEENSSVEYQKAKIKEMIEARQASGKWAFIYLGANVDAFREAGSMGINLSNVAGYKNTSQGTKSMYAAASASVVHMRATGLNVAHNLGGNIEEDGKLTGAVANPAAKVWSEPKQAGAWTPPQ